MPSTLTVTNAKIGPAVNIASQVFNVAKLSFNFDPASTLEVVTLEGKIFQLDIENSTVFTLTLSSGNGVAALTN